MRIETVKVTPQMAREWLAIDDGRQRRSIRRRTLARLGEAIDRGEWKLTHQPIAIDPTGYVLDGVHRLTAIAAQRKHVTTLVAFDADPETYSVIDTGSARTPGDALRIAGHTDGNVLAATTRIVIGYPLIIGTSETINVATRKLTAIEIVATVEDAETGKAILDSITPGGRVSRGVGRNGFRSIACALLALVALYTEHGAETQHEFTERLTDGAELPVDSPILGYRRWLINETGFARQPGWVRQTAGLALGIRTWNDYANGRERTKLGYRGGLDHMPEID